MTRERRYALEARAAALVQALVRPLPRSWALALGRALGRLLADLDPRHVAIAAENSEVLLVAFVAVAVMLSPRASPPTRLGATR